MLEDWYFDLLINCFIETKYAKNYQNRLYHSSYLLYLLSSFVDYYAQSLNDLLELKLAPVRNNIEPEYLDTTKVVNKFLNKDIKQKGKSQIVTINNVIKEIDKKYKKDKLLFEMISLLNSDKIKIQLANLRNYQTHNQPIFSEKKRHDCQNENVDMFFEKANIKNEEYEKFIGFSNEVLNIYKDLLIIYKKIIIEKYPLEKEQKEEELCRVSCENCKSKFLYCYDIVEFAQKNDHELQQYIICNNEKCHGKIELRKVDLSKKLLVHPLKYLNIFRSIADSENLPKEY